MSAVPAERIRHPEDLSDRLNRAAIDEVFAELTPEGAEHLARELLEALANARATGDLTAVSDVVEAWYRTLLFVKQPRFQEQLAAGHEGSTEGDLLAIHDLRRRAAGKA